MRSIEAAMAADYIRRGAWIIGVILLFMTAIPLWIFVALRFDGPFAGSGPEGVAVHVTLTMVMGFGAAIAVFQSQGKFERHFMRPISAARLVTCQMGLGLVTIVLMYVVATAILNLNGMGWPVVGPSLFLAATLACALAAIWSLGGNVVAQLFGCIVTTLPLMIWFQRCYGAHVFGDWQHMWFNPTAVDALTLGGITACAYGAAIAGVARARRGDVWTFDAFWQWWERTFESRYRAPRLSGPFAAQLWYEWRQKMSLFAAVSVATFLVFIFGLWLSGNMDTLTTLEVSRNMPVVVLAFLMPLIFGLMAGNSSATDQTNKGMRYMLATRPVTDQAMAFAVLRNCATALLCAWGTWLVGFFAMATCIYTSGYLEDFEKVLWSHEDFTLTSAREVVLIALTVLLISWTITTVVATMAATGRSWLLVGLLFTLFGLILSLAILKAYLPAPLFDAIALGARVVFGSVFLITTVIAYVSAMRQRLISATIVIPAVLGWGIAVGICLYISQQMMNPDPVWLWFCVTMLALSILPFAAMPLAVRWDRHR